MLSWVRCVPPESCLGSICLFWYNFYVLTNANRFTVCSEHSECGTSMDDLMRHQRGTSLDALYRMPPSVLFTWHQYKWHQFSFLKSPTTYLDYEMSSPRPETQWLETDILNYQVNFWQEVIFFSSLIIFIIVTNAYSHPHTKVVL